MSPPADKAITCTYNGCTTSSPAFTSDPSQTINHARAKGWHIWEGFLGSGIWTWVHLCPEHAGNTKREKVQRPEWDTPLF